MYKLTHTSILFHSMCVYVYVRERGLVYMQTYIYIDVMQDICVKKKLKISLKYLMEFFYKTLQQTCSYYNSKSKTLTELHEHKDILKT